MQSRALFVFISMCDPKQNARSLLTPISDTVIYPLACMVASILFSMVASITVSFKILIGYWNFLTSKKVVEKATMHSKTETTVWKSIKTVSKTNVKSDLAFSYRENKKWCFFSRFSGNSVYYQPTEQRINLVAKFFCVMYLG